MANKTSGIIIDLGRGVREEQAAPMLFHWYTRTQWDAEHNRPFNAKQMFGGKPKSIVIEQTGFESATGTKTFSIRFARKGDYKK